jgi:hypothetical protein
MRSLVVVFVAAYSVIGPGLLAQPAASLDQILERMGAYLRGYETQLSSIVADERFQQRVVYTRAYKNGMPVTSDERRRLDSEIGFIRLPGGAEWLGFRDVRKINGRDLPTTKRRVSDALAATGDVMTQARAIAEASAEHNLGVPRTTNVPTAALEIIHPRNYTAHQFERRGEDTIRKTKLAVIGFTEKRRPPLVSAYGGQELVSSGRIWIDPTAGTIWRVEWTYAPAIGSPSSLRVDFAMNDALGMMVPVEMREAFAVIGGLNARGDGVAFYDNFRRFGTSSRIVPQP